MQLQKNVKDLWSRRLAVGRKNLQRFMTDLWCNKKYLWRAKIRFWHSPIQLCASVTTAVWFPSFLGVTTTLVSYYDNLDYGNNLRYAVATALSMSPLKFLCSHPVPCNLHRNIIVILTPHRLTPQSHMLTISHNLGLYLVHLLQSRQIQIWPPGNLKV